MSHYLRLHHLILSLEHFTVVSQRAVASDRRWRGAQLESNRPRNSNTVCVWGIWLTHIAAFYHFLVLWEICSRRAAQVKLRSDTAGSSGGTNTKGKVHFLHQLELPALVSLTNDHLFQRWLGCLDTCISVVGLGISSCERITPKKGSGAPFVCSWRDRASKLRSICLRENGTHSSSGQSLFKACKCSPNG